MKVLISGHRKKKLANYESWWIWDNISCLIMNRLEWSIGLCGMADGVDLIFADLILAHSRMLHCYVPFEEQDSYMSPEDQQWRNNLLEQSHIIYRAKNSKMVEDCQTAIIVWDGQKGGTYNVFEQMVQSGKPFVWLDPLNQRITKVEDCP